METSGSGQIHYYNGILPIKKILETTNAKETEEALNICDLSQVVDKHRTWEKLMPRVKPYYAVKCNSDQKILETLADLGTNFDCASKNEIKQVLATGVAPERILFAHPCKPISHLQYAREQHIDSATVDSEFEIYKTFKHHPSSNLVVRFRCDAKQSVIPLGEKFGCDAANEATALMLLAKSLDLNVSGTSVHVGCGCKDLQAFSRTIEISKNLFEFGELLNYRMNLVDIGGGFPGDDDVAFEKFSENINNSLDEHFPDGTVNIIAEPGRYFVEAAITLICKIYAKREYRIHGKLNAVAYFLNDGIYGMFASRFYDGDKIEVQHLLDDNENLQKFRTLLWGPSCNALDMVAKNLLLPNLGCGDYLVFPNIGAYTMPMAVSFNGFPLPSILYVKKLNGYQ